MNFKRVRLRGTVETPPMLLTDEQIDGALEKFRDALARLELLVVSVEAKDEAPIQLAKSVEYLD